jgi:dihydrofolate reductase
VLRSTDDVRVLKDGDGGPILVHGSATLAQSLARADLVDRYHLLVFPLLLGSGKRLFATTDHKQKLQVIENQTYGNGITKAIYDVAR